MVGWQAIVGGVLEFSVAEPQNKFLSLTGNYVEMRDADLANVSYFTFIDVFGSGKIVRIGGAELSPNFHSQPF